MPIIYFFLTYCSDFRKVMNHGGDSEHPCHILNPREKLSVSQIKYDSAIGIL